MIRPLLLLACVSAFPISELNITAAELEILQNSTLSNRVKAATQALLPHLRIYFNQSSHEIQVTTSDVSVSDTVPDQQVDGSCSHKITAEHPKGTGTLLHNSYLNFGVANINWHGAEVFVDAKVDAQLDIASDIKVETGAKVFGHCEKIAQKTVGVNVHSTGVNGLGVNFTASNAHVTKLRNSTGYALVFDFHANVVTLVLSWNVDQVSASGCKIEILGVTIASYCGLIEKAMRNGLNKLTQTVEKVDAPKIAAKIETAINTKIGSTVTIPLKILP